jgi:hypothetical protein
MYEIEILTALKAQKVGSNELLGKGGSQGDQALETEDRVVEIALPHTISYSSVFVDLEL